MNVTVTPSCIDRMELFGGSSEQALSAFYRYSDPERRKLIVKTFGHLFQKYRDGGMCDRDHALNLITTPLDRIRTTHLPPRRDK